MMMTLNGTCGKTEIGTNFRIKLGCGNFISSRLINIWVIFQLKTSGFTQLMDHTQKIYGLHTNGLFTNNQSYGLCALWGST